MKGYYIYEQRKNVGPGIYKKIQNQCRTFKFFDIDCEPMPVEISDSFFEKLFKRIPFGPDNVKWNKLKLGEADFIYIRKNLMTGHFIKFLSKLKKTHPNVKVVIEIPTYPYFKEQCSFQNISLLFRDFLSTLFLRKYVDYLAVIGVSKKKLFGIPVITISNGVDFQSIKLRKYVKQDDVIRILCVANFAKYHGIDCFLEGLEHYYSSNGKENIQLILAGIGDLYESYVKKVNESRILKEHVRFCGVIDNDERADLFNNSDIGIVSLAYSRLHLKVNTTIKSKEYMAAGLPFITDTPIDVMNNDSQDWMLKVRYSDEPIDMNCIIDFYKKIYYHKNENDLNDYFLQMRNYSFKNSDIKEILRTIVNVLS